METGTGARFHCCTDPLDGPSGRLRHRTARIAGMGIDDLYLEYWERGWRDSDKLICSACVGDEYLRAMIEEHASSEHVCSFCGSSPAAGFNLFMGAFMAGVDHNFEQADNAGVPWEGGYVWPTVDHWDIPQHFDWVFSSEHGEDVEDEVRECLEEKTYISRWFIALEPQDAYASAWNRFQNRIKHHTRFVFWANPASAKGLLEEDEPELGEPAISTVLELIGQFLDDFRFIKTLPAGTRLIRLRGHEEGTDTTGWTAGDLGTNLPENAVNATRMSPAGIPLFYGSSDLPTALEEVGQTDRRPLFTSATFELTEDVVVVDLTVAVPIPSIFDQRTGARRGELLFLQALIAQLRQPLRAESRSHLDYVPTQVFCEYFLRVFRGGVVRGLVWRSAVADGTSVALDISNANCVESSEVVLGKAQLARLSDSRHVYRRVDKYLEV